MHHASCPALYINFNGYSIGRRRLSALQGYKIQIDTNISLVYYLVDVSLSLDPSVGSLSSRAQEPQQRFVSLLLSILTVTNVFYSPAGSFSLVRLP